MLHNSVFILIYILLGLNHLAQCDNASFKCGDCAKEHVKLCQIEEATGYSCFKRGAGDKLAKSSIKKYEHKTAPMTNDVNTCIPRGIHLDPGAEICCAWSPHTGCNLVLEKQHKGEYCSTCRIQNSEYKNLEICPCTYISKSGSEPLIWSDLNILIGITAGFYIMRKISNILC